MFLTLIMKDFLVVNSIRQSLEVHPQCPETVAPLLRTSSRLSCTQLTAGGGGVFNLWSVSE